MSELKIQQCRLDGRYDILECLGRGSYAEIYLAEDEESDGGPRRVVIKALNTHLQGYPDEDLERTLIENFRNEALALDRVRHPNIISRLGHGTAIDLTGRTFHYLVLEYMAGGDMQALCRRRPLALPEAVGYIEQIAAGLEHAHANGVIHRDIKPSNLLLTADYSLVKITDFGVAKIEAADGAITRVGTDVYAAPEHHPLAQTGQLDPAVALARGRQLTPAADVYSLAKTAYMLLTGDAPRRFSQRPVTELPDELAHEPWAPFVIRVLRRATQSNPAERYQTVREFREELRDALLPHTRLLTQPDEIPRPAPPPAREAAGEPVSSRFDSEAPPAPSFGPAASPAPHGVGQAARPRIVVRVAEPTEDAKPAPPRRADDSAPYARPAPDDEYDDEAPPVFRRRGPRLSPRTRRWLVAALLVGLFAGMLLATYSYVRGLRRTEAQTANRANRGAQQQQQQSPVGREFVATTDVNLRSDPDSGSPKIGLIDAGARVRVIDVQGSWYRVSVRQRTRPKEHETDLDEGWAWAGARDRDNFRAVPNQR